MSSVVNPVGPEEPSTYWRRRAVVAVSLLVLVWLVWMGLSTVFGGSSEASAAGSSPTPIFGLSLSDPPSEDSSGNLDPNGTEEGDGESDADETSEPEAGASQSADPEASGAVAGSSTETPGSDTASGSPSPSPKATGRCESDSVRVIVAPGAQTLSTGSGTSLTMSVANLGDLPCTHDVGSGANEIRVMSEAGKVVYSSDDCNPSTATKDTDLAPGSPWTATVTWDGRVSSPGCASAGAALSAGTYTVVARNGEISSEPVTITVQ